MDWYELLWLQENTQEGKETTWLSIKPGELHIFSLVLLRKAQQVKRREQDLPGHIPTQVPLWQKGIKATVIIQRYFDF